MERVFRHVGNQPAALSAVGYAELAHGIYRAKTELQRSLRKRFVAGLISQLSVYPFTREAADLAAKIGAEGIMAGSIIPLADLFIGTTVLSLGFSVLTANERHFRLIPNLVVLPFDPKG
jgi:predicted nucleic acid-binding protein